MNVVMNGHGMNIPLINEHLLLQKKFGLCYDIFYPDKGSPSSIPWIKSWSLHSRRRNFHSHYVSLESPTNALTSIHILLHLYITHHDEPCMLLTQIMRL